MEAETGAMRTEPKPHRHLGEPKRKLRVWKTEGPLQYPCNIVVPVYKPL